jgi:hypothetical protein
LVHNDDGAITNEVDSRLEEFFGESGESEEFPLKELEEVSNVVQDRGGPEGALPKESDGSSDLIEDTGDPDDSPLRQLRAVVLSVDWEISDETMNGLIEETERLKDVYEDDRTLVLFFQLLGAVGKYIKTHKAGAHPDSITLLNSTYSGLESVVTSKGIDEAGRKKILLVEVKKFRELKEQIGLKKADTAKKKGVGTPDEIKPVPEIQKKDVALKEVSRSPEDLREDLFGHDKGPVLPHEAFAFALEEIKEVIKAEFKALRAELKLWRKGQ